MASSTEHPFSRRFNDVAQLYDDEKLDECIVEAKNLLNDDGCPRYHYIKTLILLGDILPWEEANECCHEADVLWHVVNTWHVKGQDESADRLIADLRAPIDNLRAAIEEDAEQMAEYENEDESVDEDGDEDVDEDKNEDKNEDDAKPQGSLALHDVEMVKPVAQFGTESKFDAKMEKEITRESQLPLPVLQQPLPVRSKAQAPHRQPATSTAESSSMLFPYAVSPYGSLGRQAKRDNKRLEEILRKPSWR